MFRNDFCVLASYKVYSSEGISPGGRRRFPIACLFGLFGLFVLFGLFGLLCFALFGLFVPLPCLVPFALFGPICTVCLVCPVQPFVLAFFGLFDSFGMLACLNFGLFDSFGSLAFLACFLLFIKGLPGFCWFFVTPYLYINKEIMLLLHQIDREAQT